MHVLADTINDFVRCIQVKQEEVLRADSAVMLTILSMLESDATIGFVCADAAQELILRQLSWELLRILLNLTHLFRAEEVVEYC